LLQIYATEHEGEKTAVKTDDGLSEWFDVKVLVHQGSALSPLLFNIVMEMVSREIRRMNE
jgi:hypothetical protein